LFATLDKRLSIRFDPIRKRLAPGGTLLLSIGKITQRLPQA
jgi:hypothetical protein